ncbi:MAG TPA: glycine zipper 2TM domain-containing protein [Telluria sp.]|jgi:outer membrane lipoprotein SlyB
MKVVSGIYALLVGAALAGCASPPHSGREYTYYQAQGEQTVRMGVVESVREVSIVNPDSGTGTVAGAALGGLGGSTIGRGNGSAAMAIVGAVAGGLIGNRVESNANHKPGYEITVKLDSGELRAITQLADEMFRPGERVRLLSNGMTTRVSH